MDIPDVLALELSEAMTCCINAGLHAEVIFTMAPGSTSQGRPRVLRLRQISYGKVILTVARE